MNIIGKNIVFLGDSITAGFTLLSPEAVYWNVLAQETEANCFGYGISGTRIAPAKVPSEDPSFDLYFASRVQQIRPDADIVAIFGGSNDYGHGSAEFGSVDNMDETTFCGAYQDLIQKLKQRYPDALLFAMTPLHRLDDWKVGLNGLGFSRHKPLEGYADAIVSIAKQHEIPVLDLFHVCCLNPNDPEIQRKFMPDGLHPNEEGHKIIANVVKDFLEAL